MTKFIQRVNYVWFLLRVIIKKYIKNVSYDKKYSILEITFCVCKTVYAVL